MSVADEILRLQQAKSDLATSIAAKGVTVPAATTIDGYAALVDQIQQGGGTLPYDSKIEYLESTGTQWIDTGILYQMRMTIIMSAMCTGNYTKIQIFAAPSTEASWWFGNGNNGIIRCSASGNIGSSKVRTTITYTYGNNNGCLFGNETLIKASRTVTPTPSSIHLFSYNGEAPASARIYSCQIHDADNNVLADFIPVRKGTVGYLYDRMSKILFGNNGTGDFVLGPDVT
jgi:hypothetical protein